MEHLSPFLAVGIYIILGSISANLVSTAARNWYVTLNRPTQFMPPQLFGIIWGMIYVVMGIVTSRMYNSGNMVAFYAILLHMSGKFAWPFVYRMRRTYALIVWSLCMCGTIFACMYLARDDLNSLCMMAPYALWLFLGLIQNMRIMRLNG